MLHACYSYPVRDLSPLAAFVETGKFGEVPMSRFECMYWVLFFASLLPRGDAGRERAFDIALRQRRDARLS